MGYKLLLADDSITIQKVVGIIFSGEAYDLTVVDNGNDALLRARQATPDVMLNDAQMPAKDGFQVCREARKDPALADIPILLLTGVFDSFDDTNVEASGADDFIAKPFEAQVLIDKVSDLLALGAVRRVTPSVEPSESPSAEVEILEIEDVSALDDPWGMKIDDDEQAREIPFGTIIAPEEGESLEGFEELEPLGEEQLVAALSKVSREVIERIVWEVVPDLAEALIKEEIRKIRGNV